MTKPEFKVDFPYTLDSECRPILHVQILEIYRYFDLKDIDRHIIEPYDGKEFTDKNGNTIKRKKRFAKVSFNQVITHLHHVPSLGIRLKKGFKVDDYKALDRQGRVKYASKFYNDKEIIELQNKFAQMISVDFNPGLRCYWGITGGNGLPSIIILTPITQLLYPPAEGVCIDPGNILPLSYQLTIVSRNDNFITSYAISIDKLDEMRQKYGYRFRVLTTQKYIREELYNDYL